MRTKRLKRLVSVAVAMAFVLAMITPAVAALSPGLYYNGYFYSESYINSMTLAEKVALTNELNAANDGYYIMNLAGQTQYVLFKSYTGFSSFKPVTDTDNPLQPTYISKADGSTVETGAQPAGVTVTAINAINPIEVENGTANPTLPATITLQLSNNTTADVAVTWACATYDGNVAGEYTFTGTYELPTGVTGEKPAATVKVTVKEAVAELKVESVSAINLKTFTVNFNKAVDKTEGANKANYTIKKKVDNSSVTTEAVVLAEDTKSAIVIAGSADAAGLEVGKEYTLTVKKVEASVPTAGITKDFTVEADVVIPQVTEVQAIGNKVVKVIFSEPVNKAKSNTLADGTGNFGTNFEIKGPGDTAWTIIEQSGGDSTVYKLSDAAPVLSADYKTVTLNFASALAIGEYSFKVRSTSATPIADFAGSVAPAVLKNFTVSTPTQVAQPTGVTINNRQEIIVTFDGPIVAAGAAAVDFTSATKSGASNTGTAVSSNPNQVKYAFSGANALPIGEVTIKVNAITDGYGNTTPSKSFTVTVTENAPLTVKAEQDGSAQNSVKIVFSQSMQDDSQTNGADRAANYTIKTADGAAVTPTITGAAYTEGTKTTVLTLSANLPAGSYVVTMENLKNAIGDLVGTQTASFDIADKTAGELPNSIVTGYQFDTNSTKPVLIVKYPEKMDTTTERSVLNKINYAIFDKSLNGGAGGSVDLGANDTVEAVTGLENAIKIALDNFNWDEGNDGLKIKAVNDFYGNLYETKTYSTITPDTAYTITNAVAKITAPKAMEVTFARPLSAIDKADFTLSGGQTINTISYVNDFKNSKAVVTVTTTGADFAAGQALQTIATPTKTKDFAGILLAAGGPLSSAGATSGVAPKLERASVVAKDKIRLTFDKNMLAVGKDDFKVSIGGTQVPVHASTAAAMVGGDAKVWDLTLKDAQSVTVTPVVELGVSGSLVQSIDTDGNKLTVPAAITASNIRVDSISWDQGASKFVLNGDKLVIKFTEAVKPQTLYTGWDGSAAQALTKGTDIKIIDNASSDYIEFLGSAANLGKVLLGSTVVVTGDVTPGANPSMTLSTDAKTLTITFGDESALAGFAPGNIGALNYQPTDKIMDKEGKIYLNAAFTPITASVFAKALALTKANATKFTIANNYGLDLSAADAKAADIKDGTAKTDVTGLTIKAAKAFDTNGSDVKLTYANADTSFTVSVGGSPTVATAEDIKVTITDNANGMSAEITLTQIVDGTVEVK